MSVENSVVEINSIRNNSNFFQIRRIPFDQTAKSYRLMDVYRAVVEFYSITLGRSDLKNILLYDLHTHEINLRQPLLNVLEEAVLHYCKAWEGWARPDGYYKPDLEFQAGFTALREFLTTKCKFIIAHAEEHIQEVAKNAEESQEIDSSENTCGYKLIIGGLPMVLNTIAVAIKGQNILIKRHELQPWSTLTMTELLNWPFLSVEVKLLDLHIKRTNTHEFARYIAKANQKLPAVEEDFISNIMKISDGGKPYTHTFFSFYFIQLHNVLQKIEGINGTRLKELREIYTQFTLDVKEMNIAHGSMSTETTIKFHIGKKNYARSKQMFLADKNEVKNDVGVVNFVEHIVPQVDLTLFYCTAIQDMDDTNSVTFKKLNIVSQLVNADHPSVKNLKHIVNNICIEYSCTFCYKKYTNSRALKDIIVHFAQQHKVGHPVVCFKCHKQFLIKNLAGSRWEHSCV